MSADVHVSGDGEGLAQEGPEHDLMYRWFVQYNPLYFFSTLCVLGGVFLISNGLERVAAHGGTIVLAFVVQAYEIFLLIGAALLFRVAGERRPAVIIGGLELFFLFDWVFQSEAVSTLTAGGLIFGMLWVSLAVLKLMALTWIFRLRVSFNLMLAAVLMLVGIGAGPQLLTLAGQDHQTVHVLLTWYGAAMVALVCGFSVRVVSSEGLDDWGQCVLRRATRTALAVGGAMYVAHLAAWASIFGVSVSWAHLVPVLVGVALFSRQERWLWAQGVTAVGLSMLQPEAVWFTSTGVATLFLIKGFSTRCPRLFIGTIVGGYIAACTWAWPGWAQLDPHIALTLVAVVALTGLSCVCRMPSAVIVAGLLICLIPRTMLESGVVALSIGFASLVAGVAISWNGRNRDALAAAAP